MFYKRSNKLLKLVYLENKTSYSEQIIFFQYVEQTEQSLKKEQKLESLMQPVILKGETLT